MRTSWRIRGPGQSYPTTSEEATKVILSLLLTSPAVIEFDDMDTDWIPHGTIKRMLTAEHHGPNSRRQQDRNS